MQEELRILKKLVEQKIREEEAERAEDNGDLIGELPNDLMLKLNKLRKIKERLNEDVDLRKHQLQLECQRKLEEEFDERQEAYMKQHKEAWGEIYKTMLIDPNGSYFQDEGKLYEYRDSKKPSFKMVDFTKPSRR